MKYLILPALLLVALLGTVRLMADTVEFTDGTKMDNCFVRDEGVRYLIWENWTDVGSTKMKVVPRSQVKSWKKIRDDKWDEHPKLPDLSVTFIEMNPKLAGLHGLINYDDPTGRMIPKGAKTMVDVGERGWMHPEEIVKNLKLKYEPGETITLTAHVRNVGFDTAKPFEYIWLIDGKQIGSGKCTKSLKEMEEATFPLKWKWEDGFHTATFKIKTEQPEIANINNEATDPLWGLSFSFVVSNGKAKAWHQVRSAVGTFSFEDYYRWHVDLMNVLFANSIWPSAPEGIKARVRLDRIVYTDGDPTEAQAALVQPDGIRYDQGNWTWTDSEEEMRTGKFQLPSKDWYTGTEWSLPHELGHQLGIADWYWIDYNGTDYHVWQDNGEPITHFELHPNQMMHWHGPNLYGEVDANYLNETWNKPRGYFADYYFAIPKENYIKVVDVNGNPIPYARVEMYQRGTLVDPAGAPMVDQGVIYFPVVEDGNFEIPCSRTPVIIGMTDKDGMMHLPNRPVAPVKTLNGYERRPNPFGNMNVMGNRGELLTKVTKESKPAWFMLEIYDFNIAWFRGQKDKFIYTLKTPFGGTDSPQAPIRVKAEYVKTSDNQIDKDHVKITWEAAPVAHERQYIEGVIGYRVYRRIGSMTLNDRPWFPVATLGPNERECIIDLKQYPEDTYWYSGTNRFAVSSIGQLSKESELIEALPVLPPAR